MKNSTILVKKKRRTAYAPTSYIPRLDCNDYLQKLHNLSANLCNYLSLPMSCLIRIHTYTHARGKLKNVKWQNLKKNYDD